MLRSQFKSIQQRLAGFSLVVVLLQGCDSAERNIEGDGVAHRSIEAIVVSGSMEPTLSGPYRKARCESCRLDYRYSESSIDVARPVFCPSCGKHSQWLEGVFTPEAIRYQPITAQHPIRRNDIVVFESDGRKQVKRIVGLPGETIAIRDGDLWLADRPIRKSLYEMLGQSILVHAESGVVGNAASSRWQSKDDWLRYGHRSLWPVRGGVQWLHAEPIMDECFFNQGESKTLEPVHDIGLVLNWSAAATFRTWDIAIQWRNMPLLVEVVRGEESLRIKVPAAKDSAFEFSLIGEMSWGAIAIVDGSLWFGCDDGELRLVDDLSQVARRQSEVTDPLVNELQPVAYRIDGDEPLQRFVVRDLHRRSGDGNREQVMHSGVNRYIVLGDNDAISEDSRSVLEVGIERSLLRGIVPPDGDILSSVKRQMQGLGVPWEMSVGGS